YTKYLAKHPASKYDAQAKEKLQKLEIERDWHAAQAKNEEDVWIAFIAKYSGTKEAEDALAQLRDHNVVRANGIIPWTALGGHNWSQPLEDGFSNHEGATVKNATIANIDKLIYNCNDKTEFNFP